MSIKPRFQIYTSEVRFSLMICGPFLHGVFTQLLAGSIPKPREKITYFCLLIIPLPMLKIRESKQAENLTLNYMWEAGCQEVLKHM